MLHVSMRFCGPMAQGPGQEGDEGRRGCHEGGQGRPRGRSGETCEDKHAAETAKSPSKQHWDGGQGGMWAPGVSGPCHLACPRRHRLGPHPVDLQIIDATEVQLAIPGRIFWREAKPH